MAQEKRREDELEESLEQLFTSISTMIKGELEGKILAITMALFVSALGTINQLLLLEKMNHRVAEEYSGFRDVSSGLRVFVEQLGEKNHSFDEYVQQIDAIDLQVTEFEAVVSMLDKHVSLLEKKVQSMYQNSPA